MKKLIISLLMLPVLSLMGCENTSSGNNKLTSLGCTEVCAQDGDFDMNANYAVLMAESIASGDYSQAKYYDRLRNKKKEYLGIQDNLTYDNLLLLAKIIHAEAGSSWLTEEHRQLVASVVINRVNSSEFPNTIYDVIHQRGQYSSAGTKYFNSLKPSKACVFSALKVLANGSIAPKDVVFQAGFKQGSGVYKSINDRILGTTYFCYSSNRKLYE